MIRYGIGFFLIVSGCVFGLAQERFGPVAADRIGRNPDWPEGTKALMAHPSRVYSLWVNGTDRIYFDAGPQEVNELLKSFSELAILDHEVRIESGRQTRQSLREESVEYNVYFSSPGGIGASLLTPGEAVKGWRLPTLSVYADPSGELFKTLRMPGNLIVHSDLSGCPRTGLQKPQRNPYVTRFVLRDGTSASGEGHQTKITLWEQGRSQGWVLGKAGFQGIFEMFFSAEEMANLAGGKMWLTATYGNYMTTPKPTDQRIGTEYLTPHVMLAEMEEDESLKTLREGTFVEQFDAAYAHAKRFVVEQAAAMSCYGRILFEDGSPAVLDPNVWKGRRGIFVSMPYHHCEVDENGYFSAIYTAEQFGHLRDADQSGLIYIPVADQPNQGRGIAKFSIALMSSDKAAAGAVKIREPEPPHPELTEAKALKDGRLPKWKGIEFNMDAANLEGRWILVCFWDSGQRPSRNTVQRLWEQAEIMDEKGAAVLLIHAGTNHPAADAWLDENGITFTNGRITGDPFETRFAWNVQALPWLIVADAEHTVKAEGLGVGELEAF